MHTETVTATPQRDRYQIVHQHPRHHLIVQDTGPGIEPTDDIVLVTVTSRPRERAMKETFFSGLVTALGRHCDLLPEDLVLSIIENTDEDWSFGHGRAQFLTCDL